MGHSLTSTFSFYFLDSLRLVRPAPYRASYRCSASRARHRLVALGLAVGWWLLICAVPFLLISILGWTFEFFRGEKAI